MAKRKLFFQNSKIPIFTPNTKKKEIVAEKLKTKFETVKFKKIFIFSFPKIIIYAGLMLIPLLLGFALYLVVYGNQNVNWFAENKRGLILMIVIYSLFGIILISLFFSWIYSVDKNYKLLLNELTLQWWLQIVTDLYPQNNNDFKINNITKKATQNCLFWDPIIPYFYESKVTSFFTWFRKVYLCEPLTSGERKMLKIKNIAKWKKRNDLWYVYGPQLNGFYKHIACTIGSVKRYQVVNTGQSSTIIENVFSYVNFQVPNDTKLIAEMTPKSKFDLIAKIRKKKERLESIEFEKLFKLKCNDPVMLRKLLQPKVMADILNASEAIEFTPKIKINHCQISILLASRKGWIDKNCMFQYYLSLNKKKFVEKNLHKLIQSVGFTQECLKWINIFV